MSLFIKDGKSHIGNGTNGNELIVYVGQCKETYFLHKSLTNQEEVMLGIGGGVGLPSLGELQPNTPRKVPDST